MTLAQQPRRSGPGVESPEAAKGRVLEDGAIVSLAFCAGLRRSEIAALRWRDVSATDRLGVCAAGRLRHETGRQPAT